MGLEKKRAREKNLKGGRECKRWTVKRKPNKGKRGKKGVVKRETNDIQILRKKGEGRAGCSLGEVGSRGSLGLALGGIK